MRQPLDSLRAHRYARLTTFRSSGEEVHTPVWFVMHDNAVYVETGDQTGKAKRVRRDPRVIIAPCTPWGSPRGPGIPATAKDLGSAPPAHIRAALLRRYGPLQWFRDFLLRRRRVTPTFLEITAEPGGVEPS